MKKGTIACLTLLSSYGAYASERIENVEVIGENRNTENIYSKRIDAEDLNSSNTVIDFQELTFQAPSIGTIKSGRSVAITVNGLGYNGGFHNPSLEPSVAMYIDGVYIPRQSIISTGFPAIESVTFSEGLKDTHPITSGVGTIDISTQKPTLRKHSAFFESTVGSDNLLSLGAGASLALTDQSSASIYLSDTNDDGRLKNFHSGDSINVTDNTLGYVRYVYESNEGLSAFLNYYYAEDNNDWNGTGQTFSHSFNIGANGEALFSTIIPLGYQLFGLEQQNDGQIDLPSELNYEGTSNNTLNRSQQKNQLSSLTVQKDLGSLSIISTTGYFGSDQEYAWDVDNTDYDLSSQDVIDDYSSISQEIGFTYSGSRYEAHGGLYFSQSESNFNYETYLGDDILVLSLMGTGIDQQRAYILNALNNEEPSGQHLSTDANNNEEVDRYSLYTNVQFGSGYRFGFNVTEVNKRFKKSNDGLCSFDTADQGIHQCSPTRLRGVLDSTYFRGSTRSSDLVSSLYVFKGWEINQHNHTYFSAGRSQKPGGFNSMQSVGGGPGQALSIDNLKYAPETNYSVDLGYRRNFANNSFYALNVFGHIIEDYQLNYFNSFGFEVINAKSVKSYGGKFQTQYNIGNTLDLVANINYAKSYYANNERSLCPPIEFRTAENCSHLSLGEALAVGETLISDASGSDLRSPRLTSHIAIKNNFSISELDISHNLEYKFTGKRRTTEFDIQQFYRGGYGTINYNLSASYKRLSFILALKNITDKRAINLEFPSTIVRAIVGGTGRPDSTYGMNAIANEPRTLAATISVKL